MTDQELDQIKKKISVAYLHALTAKVNFSMSKYEEEVDGMGFDFTVFNHSVGTKRTVHSEASEIKIQLKGTTCSSTSMFKDDVDCVKYNLTSELPTFGFNHYIFIVQVLEEENIEKWLEFSDQELILRKCAYFYKIPNPGQPKGWITIPKTNLITPESFKGLFLSSIDKVNV